MLTQKQLARLSADMSRFIAGNRQAFVLNASYPANEFSEPLHDTQAIVAGLFYECSSIADESERRKQIELLISTSMTIIAIMTSHMALQFCGPNTASIGMLSKIMDGVTMRSKLLTMEIISNPSMLSVSADAPQGNTGDASVN